MNTQITEDFVSFETAKLLKEKGFDENINTYRDDFIQHGSIVIPLQECLSKDKVKTPTLQMAMKWLREVHNIVIVTFPIRTVNNELAYNVSIYNTNAEHKKLMNKDYQTYEQACEAAIKYCLTNLI